jgi:acetolactate synthase-1/3 small subunit
MRHTISVLVENKFGVLARVSGLFSGRGFNIDSLNVAPTQDPALSRVTVVVRGDDTVLDQINKQLLKLINVIEVIDFKEGQAVERELVLAKIKADTRTRSEIIQIVDIFRAKIIMSPPTRDRRLPRRGKDQWLLSMVEPGILSWRRTGKPACAAESPFHYSKPPAVQSPPFSCPPKCIPIRF